MNFIKIDSQKELHIIGVKKLLTQERIREIAVKNNLNQYSVEVSEVYSKNKGQLNFKSFAYKLNY